ncbi:unnamed protein product, partial [Phaeothamnion confervicola]
GFAVLPHAGRLFALNGRRGDAVAVFDEGFTFGELRRFFVRLDADGSGRIARDELAAAIRGDASIATLLGADRDVDPADAADVFRSLDADGDGAVTWEEFAAFFRPGGARGTGGSGEGRRGGCGSRAAVGSSSMEAAWRAEPWAAGVGDEELRELTHAFSMFDESGDGK